MVDADADVRLGEQRFALAHHISVWPNPLNNRRTPIACRLRSARSPDRSLIVLRTRSTSWTTPPPPKRRRSKMVPRSVGATTAGSASENANFAEANLHFGHPAHPASAFKPTPHVGDRGRIARARRAALPPRVRTAPQSRRSTSPQVRGLSDVRLQARAQSPGCAGRPRAARSEPSPKDTPSCPALQRRLSERPPALPRSTSVVTSNAGWRRGVGRTARHGGWAIALPRKDFSNRAARVDSTNR
jgi:hypothetical protein